jgi:hypothetical protein
MFILYKCSEICRRTSAFWQFFEEIIDSNGITSHGKCLSCSRKINVTKGVSGLSQHISSCDRHAARSSNLIQAQLGDSGGFKPIVGLQRSKDFSVNKARQKFAQMIILDELPFLFSEHEGFRDFIKYVCPDYEKFILGRHGVKADVKKVWQNLKVHIQDVIDNAVSRVSFTSDIWTCNHTSIGFMVVTAHFISKDWQYFDIVLSFKKMAPNHTGYNINQLFKDVIREWKLENKVMAITLDNASSNGAFIDELLRSTPPLNFIKENGKPLIHVKCFAHILNLIAADGLEEMKGSIEGLRNAIKKSQSSHASIAAFQVYCDSCNIPSTQAKPSLDVPTRWNSTYDMLETSIPYLPAFDLWSQNSDNAPQAVDMFHKLDILDFHQFLHPLKEMTLEVSTHSEVSMHQGLSFIYALKKQLTDLVPIGDHLVQAKERMVKKFDKYFSLDQPRVNLIIYFIASIFDPTTKFDFIRQLFSEEEAELILSRIKSVYNEFYKCYEVDHLSSSGTLSVASSGSSKYVAILGKQIISYIYILIIIYILMLGAQFLFYNIKLFVAKYNCRFSASGC